MSYTGSISYRNKDINIKVSVAKATVIVVTIGLLYVRTVRGSNDCRIFDA
jgi:hypothetical protein